MTTERERLLQKIRHVQELAERGFDGERIRPRPVPVNGGCLQWRKVEIVDCVPVEEIMHKLTERERVLGDYSPGRFAWVLQNPIMFEKSIPARGKQGWWNWEGDAE